MAEIPGEETVVGWARVSAYSDRCVYGGVGEHGVYVASEAQGRGIGRLLLEALATAAEKAVTTSSRAASSRRTRRAWPSTARPASPRSACSCATGASMASGRTACSSSVCSDRLASDHHLQGGHVMADQIQQQDELREIVRERYAAAAKGARTGASCCDDAVGASRGGVFGDALYGSEADECASRSRGRVARLWRSDSRCRTARGRDRARSRLGRRRGRADQRWRVGMTGRVMAST